MPISESTGVHERTRYFRRWETWAIVVALALLFGLLESVQLHLGSVAIGRQPITIFRAILRVLPFWLLVACSAPPIVALAHKFRPVRFVFWSRVPIQVVTAVVFAFVLLAGRTLLDPLGMRPPGVMRPSAWDLLQTYFVIDVLALLALVGVFDGLYYYREARSRELAASRLQTSLAEARLKILSAQLKPHFLFNTLNAISVLALEGRNKDVVEMLGRLSQLLRISLHIDGPAEVPLSKEMMIVTNYLEIQRIRFYDRLTFLQDIAPDAAEAMVPAMILQPIVENAVVHGIAPLTRPGRITVSARRSDGLLVLEVSDSGPGFSTTGPIVEAGVGLANTRARLEQLYGPGRHLECAEGPDGGALVRLRIPYRKEQPAENNSQPDSNQALPFIPSSV